MNINDFSKEIHAVNVANGFWEKPNDVTTQRMLITSELYEAFESHREGKFCGLEHSAKQAFLTNYEKDVFIEMFKSTIKDTIEDEIADAAIRILDYGCYLDVDFSKKIVTNFYWSNNFIIDLDVLIEGIRGIVDRLYSVIELDFCYWLIVEFAEVHNIDLETHMRLKVEYNKTRPYKHGKNY